MSEIVKRNNNELMTQEQLSMSAKMRSVATELYYNNALYDKISKMSALMSNSGDMIPKHLRENEGACMAVQVQALQWGMNPFSVAQKTFNLDGKIGYEAQLVNAVVHTMTPIKERSFEYEFFGDWERILNKPNLASCQIQEVSVRSYGKTLR